MIAINEIISPEGESPARWRARVDGHTGTGVMCGVLFTDGAHAEPISDMLARKLMAAVGTSVTVTPWDEPAVGDEPAALIPEPAVGDAPVVEDEPEPAPRRRR